MSVGALRSNLRSDFNDLVHNLIGAAVGKPTLPQRAAPDVTPETFERLAALFTLDVAQAASARAESGRPLRGRGDMSTFPG